MKSDSTSFDVRQIAQLARLALSPEEATTFQTQLANILHHVEKLNSVDVTDVEPATYAQPVFNIFRKDEVRAGLDREQILANAPKAANNLIVVTKVVE